MDSTEKLEDCYGMMQILASDLFKLESKIKNEIILMQEKDKEAKLEKQRNSEW